jgi:Spy/CpxP family protein refolding chaperone
MLSKIIKGGLVSCFMFTFCTVAIAQQTTTTPQTEVAPQTKAERRLLRQERMRGRFGKLRRQALGKAVRNLNLTDAQKEQLKALRQKYGAEFSAQRQEIRTLAQKKHQGTLTADEQARLDALKAQMKSRNEEMRKQIDAILTPEQIKQRDEMKQRREEMRKFRQERRKLRQTQKPPTSDGTIIN